MADHGKAKRGIPPKSDFNAWYPAIVEIAELVDKRYPIKGMDVWRPYGWKAMRCIDNLTHAEMERTDHQEVRFPSVFHENISSELSIVSTLRAVLQMTYHRSVFRLNLSYLYLCL